MDDIENTTMDSTLTKAIINQLKDIEGIDEWLNMMCNVDKNRYFDAQDESSRENIRGHHSFAKYLKLKIIKSRK